MYYPFLASLEQISKAEEILGAAQTVLMQSLHYESLARGYRVSAKKKTYGRTPHPFMINGLRATSIDQIGMAAYAGMTRYVCEQLDISVESRSYPLSFPDLNHYSRSKRTTATLAWSGLTDTRNQKIDFALEMRSSKYRQAISKCLQWTSDTQWSSQSEFLSENKLLAETYMLCCCRLTSSELVRVLLRAGANPMVRVKSMGTKPREVEFNGTVSFWHNWLYGLLLFWENHARASGRSEGSWLRDQDIGGNMTSNDIFDITKALLAKGADINHQLENLDSLDHGYPKLQDLELYEHFNFSLTTSAMFILEQCFGTESEFREFAVAAEPLVERPTRKIVKISRFYSYNPTQNDHEIVDPCPSAEESELLLRLFEKWENTGRQDDQDAFGAALEEVWTAHNPGVEMRKWSDSLSDSSDSEATNSEHDGDDDDENDDEHDEDDDYDINSSDSCD